MSFPRFATPQLLPPIRFPDLPMSAALSVEELRHELQQLGLNTKGLKPELRQRLKRGRAIFGNRTQAANQQTPSEPIEWQPEYDSFLVLDVEATCERNRKYGFDSAGPPPNSPGAFFSAKITNYDYPNEIIEFPVVLLQWSKDGQQLEIRDTFQSYVRPTWRPNLSQFCRELTGITQEQVDAAPVWNEVVLAFYDFLKRHGLLKLKSQGENGPARMYDRRLRAGVAWVTHGPADLRDFVIKQCWVAGHKDDPHHGAPPFFLRGPLIDVRRSITALYDWERNIVAKSVKEAQAAHAAAEKIAFGGDDGFQVVKSASAPSGLIGAARSGSPTGLTKQDLSLKGLLELLGLGAFEGREHCGLDDTRNVARLVIELGRRTRAMANGQHILFIRNAPDSSTDDGAKTPQNPAEIKAAADKARKMERECLLPNTRTDRVEKRWRFMGLKAGSVQWKFPPEDDAVSATDEVQATTSTPSTAPAAVSSANRATPVPVPAQ